MRGLLSLLSINLIGKLLSIFVFAFLVRVMEAEHLAYIGLIPAFAALLLAMLGFGVGTLLERDVPRLRASDPAGADALLRSGFLVAIASVGLMFLLLWILRDFWTGLLLGQYAVDARSIRWIALPIAAYMLAEINGWMFIIRNDARNYGIISVYSDIAAKLGALGLYWWHPSETSVFFGLALGQLPFFLGAIWSHQKWLFRGPLRSLRSLVWSSRIFYVESCFNAVRERGDSLLVSSTLGPIAMAGYYVAKAVAAQLTVLFLPVTSIIIPLFSSRVAHGKPELALAFRQVWSTAAPFFIWAASSVAAASPFLLAVFAGPEYADQWQTALILCYVTAAMGLYAISSRILLLLGSSAERFRVVMIHAALIAGIVVLLRGRLGPEGVALAWLVATLLTIMVVRLRARRIGFAWPATTAVRRAILICVPVPLIALFVIGYGHHPDWSFVAWVGGLSILSLLGLVLAQDPFEVQQLRSALPPRLDAAYVAIRRLASRA